MMGVLIRGNQYTYTERPYEYMEKMGIYKLKREASPETNLANTLISGVQLSEQRGNAFLLFKPASL